MDIDQQDIAVDGAQRLDLVADRAQLLVVAVRGLAVGDVEDHGRETFGVGRAGSPAGGYVPHAAQCLAHRRLPGRQGLDPRRCGNLPQGDAAVGKPVFDHLRVHRHLLCREGADRHQILASGQQRAYLVVTRITDHGDVVIVAYAVAAACPFDELEQQVVGDGCNRFGLGHAASPEEDAFGHRPRAVYGQDECRAVVACDALCIHVASI